MFTEMVPYAFVVVLASLAHDQMPSVLGLKRQISTSALAIGRSAPSPGDLSRYLEGAGDADVGARRGRVRSAQRGEAAQERERGQETAPEPVDRGDLGGHGKDRRGRTPARRSASGGSSRQPAGDPLPTTV